MLLRETTARVDSLSAELAIKEQAAHTSGQQVEGDKQHITRLKTKLAKFIVHSNLRAEEIRSDAAWAAAEVNELVLADERQGNDLALMTSQLAEVQKELRLAQERAAIVEDEAKAAHERLSEELTQAQDLQARTQAREEEAVRESERLHSELLEAQAQLNAMKERLEFAEATREKNEEDERQLRAELERLSEEKITKVSELLDVRAQDSQRMAALQEEVAALKDALEQQQDRRDQESRGLISRAAQLDAVTVQLLETTAACGELMEEVRRGEISHCRGRLKWEMKKDASTAALLHDIPPLMQLLSREIDELRHGWEQDAAAVGNRVEALKSLLANKMDSCRRLVDVKDACSLALRKLDLQASELEDSIASVTEEVTSVKDQYQTAMARKDAEASEEMVQLRQTLGQQQDSEVGELMRALQKLEKDRDAAVQQSVEREAEVCAKNRELELLTQKVLDLQVLQDQAQREAEEANQDVQRLSAEVLTLEALNRSLVAAVSPMNVTFTLDLDWSAAGKEKSAEREAFEKALAEEITAAAASSVGRRGGEMPQDCIRITAMSAGSVVVDLEVHAHPSGASEAGAGAGDDPVSIAADLQRQVEDRSSPLFAGAILKNTKRVSVSSKRDLLETVRQLREDLAAEQEGLRLAQASIQAYAKRLDMANEEISNMTQNLKEEVVLRESTGASNEMALSELQKQLHVAKTQVSAEQHEAQTLLQRAEEAEAKLGRQHMQHVQDLRVLQEQVETLEQKGREKDDEILKLKDECSQSSQHEQEQAQQRMVKEEELQSLQAETERISAEKLQQISDLEARRAQDSRQMTVLEEEVATLRQDLKAAQAKNAAAAVAEERLRSEAMAAQRQAEESAAEASQAAASARESEQESVRTQEKVRAGLNAELSEAVAGLEKAQAELEKKQAELEKTQGELRLAEERAKESQEELAAAQEQSAAATEAAAANEALLRSQVMAAERQALAAVEEARQAVASAGELKTRLQQSQGLLVESEARASTLGTTVERKCAELHQVQQVLTEKEAMLWAAQARSPKSPESPSKREIELKISPTGQHEAPHSTAELELAAVQQEIRDLQSDDAVQSPTKREIESKISARKSASRKLFDENEKDRKPGVSEHLQLQDVLHEKTAAAKMLLEAGVGLSEGMVGMCTELQAILSSISDETLDAQDDLELVSEEMERLIEENGRLESERDAAVLHTRLLEQAVAEDAASTPASATPSANTRAMADKATSRAQEVRGDADASLPRSRPGLGVESEAEGSPSKPHSTQHGTPTVTERLRTHTGRKELEFKGQQRAASNFASPQVSAEVCSVMIALFHCVSRPNRHFHAISVT